MEQNRFQDTLYYDVCRIIGDAVIELAEAGNSTRRGLLDDLYIPSCSNNHQSGMTCHVEFSSLALQGASMLINTADCDKAQLMGWAIGAAVINLVSRGGEINHETIVNELDHRRKETENVTVEASTRDAATLLRKSRSGS